jgi:hypothetical protein
MQLALWTPLLVAALLLAVGSMAMLLLPEPAGKPLDDSVAAAVSSGLLSGGKSHRAAAAAAEEGRADLALGVQGGVELADVHARSHAAAVNSSSETARLLSSQQ